MATRHLLYSCRDSGVCTYGYAHSPPSPPLSSFSSSSLPDVCRRPRPQSTAFPPSSLSLSFLLGSLLKAEQRSGQARPPDCLSGLDAESALARSLGRAATLQWPSRASGER